MMRPLTGTLLVDLFKSRVTISAHKSIAFASDPNAPLTDPALMSITELTSTLTTPKKPCDPDDCAFWANFF
jgi:hypothetical protein